jgi:hypothetical protein
MVFGLALVMALVFGVATMAFAANGNNFVLGVLTNTATRVTNLTANVAGKPALQLQNTNTAPGSRALQLNVARDKAPLTVNATAGKATNLNADKVDGHDAPMWAVVNADGSIPHSSDASILSFQTGNTGEYTIQFNRDVSACAYQATLSEASLSAGEIAAFTGNPSTDVDVYTYTSASAHANGRFHLTVNC